MRILVALFLLASASCVPEKGPLMAPGQDCLECHGSGEGEDDAKAWTVAGTWARGAHIEVVDANGKKVPMRGNKVGNFYTAESLTPPLTVSVDGVTMDNAAALTFGGSLVYGGCNLCHVNGGLPLTKLAGGGTREALMGLMAPSRDCLRCHDGNLAPRFYAAGTFPGRFPPGRTVVISGSGGTATATTNAVGNFWITVQLGTLLEATVDGERMPPEKGLAPNCNACHKNGKADD